MSPPLNLAGQRFGKITLRIRSPTQRDYWLGTCECTPDVERPFYGSRIANGKLLHCGCERVSHGHTAGGRKSPTYVSWENMLARCRDTETTGADGTVSRARDHDPRWNDFATFLKDMGERPPGQTLDRANPLRGYSKQNCRWAERSVQDNNKTNSKQYEVRTLQGQHFTGTALDWAEWFTRETGISMKPNEFRVLMRFFAPEQIFCALHPRGGLDSLTEWGRVQASRAEDAARASQVQGQHHLAQRRRYATEFGSYGEDTGYVEDGEYLT